jgi:hypothetical protein
VKNESGDYEVFMTPDDFVRSITPGIKQPEGKNTWDEEFSNLFCSLIPMFPEKNFFCL